VQTFTLVIAINAGVPDGTILTNTANISSTTADPNPANNSDQLNTVVTDLIFADGFD
jgi:hypothetical protein